MKKIHLLSIALIFTGAIILSVCLDFRPSVAQDVTNHVFVLNEGSGQSCRNLCANVGFLTVPDYADSIGTDDQATNGLTYISDCTQTDIYSYRNPILRSGSSCAGHLTDWTNCACLSNNNADPEPINLPYLITNEIPSSPANDIFFVKQFTFYYSGGSVLLSSNSDGTGEVFVNDILWFYVIHTDRTYSEFSYDFSNGCSDGIESSAPIDVSDKFQLGLNTINIYFRDLCGGSQSSSRFYLSTVNPASSVDLYIADIQPIQAVEDLNLVTDKPLAIRVWVGTTGFSYDQETQQTPIKISASFQDATQSKTVTLGDLIQPVDFIFPDVNSGTSDINVWIDPDDEIVEIDETNNDNTANPLQTDVRDTSGFRLIFVKVECYGTVQNYYDTASHGSQFVLAQWPLSRSDLGVDISPVTMTECKNLDADYRLLQKKGREAVGSSKNSKTDYIIGIVDENYFSQIGHPEYTGLTQQCGSHLIFVKDGYWQAVAHELGHAFTFQDVGTEVNRRCSRTSDSGDEEGYWVDQHKPISTSHSLMEQLSAGTFPDPIIWIGENDYTYLYNFLLTK